MSCIPTTTKQAWMQYHNSGYALWIMYYRRYTGKQLLAGWDEDYFEKALLQG